ncbi:MAG TPA: long-chain-acyl-CoA synthetase [Caulobacteraceae bacterium]
MGLGERLRREWRFLSGLVRTLARVQSIKAASPWLICDDLEAAVDRWRGRPAISFEGHPLTYGQLDEMANRFAHWAYGEGIYRGQTVALLAANSPEYLAVWFGLSKVGVTTALINNHLAAEALAHCLNISGARHCLVDAQTAASFEAARSLLAQPMEEWTLAPAHAGQRSLQQAMKGLSVLRPNRALRAGATARETAMLIYTSGTTGLPKAARVTHMRAQLYMRGFAGATGARPDDRVLVTLPLYHATGGLCAVGAALLNGACVIVQRHFSASHFWAEVAAEKATMFVYIGELCRYLVNQTPSDAERGHPLRLAFGNGLGPDVWATLEKRFAIPRVLEFYGSTEGNVSLFNFDGNPGAIGRVPRYLLGLFNVRLVRFDVETGAEVRGAGGFCIEAGPNEVGECLGRIDADARTAYTGYADRSASEKKILRDVFTRGDAWFRTGDLLRKDRDGYFFFVDRVGDTFRWKGENVSTTEVADTLLTAPGVLEVNVYGVIVPGHDGRAGMAAMVVGKAFDLDAFSAHVARRLPAYSQPVFLRLLKRLETTGTFKVRKLDLQADGFDPARTQDPLFVHQPGGGFRAITNAVHAQIVAGEIRL